MNLKKFLGKLHLWLGLSSGLVVFIVAVTGCIYAFQAEIQDLTQSHRFVEPKAQAILPPSKISEIAHQVFPEGHLHAVLYPKPDRSAQAIFFSYGEGHDHYKIAYVNPYSGEVLKVKDENKGFFPFILDGHFYLWLPDAIGQKVVGIFTLIFLFMIISGLVLWWPKGKNLKQSLTVKWNARWRRKNYDLHQVLGFYVMVFALVFVVTGLVWSFFWFRDGYYSLLTGKEQFVEYYDPISDSTQIWTEATPALDKVWLKMREEYPNADYIEVHPPELPHAAIAANANPDGDTYWQIDYRYFDQYTLEELPVEHMWGRIDEASTGEKLFRMNYDIHVGAIGGFPGKLLAFFLSAIIASLPVTGFLVWWGRRNKVKKNLPKKEVTSSELARI
ncbi:PepSY domain-containing protein [Algoriphagus aestuariicola]|uniref:PepSY domain-containing protein n=1 Tax=Algoriphagus aestuariicola TaxID=1852016 RepID=A0ABS3BJS3_9BACT|nr:PepSY domain-containing protein [Algoriphagus aestuariicola]